ncbi:hypothetical protein [Polaromonas sp. P5_D5]|jgi:hypothetical protein
MKINPQVVIDELIDHLTALVLHTPEIEKLRQRRKEGRFSRAGYQLLGALPDGPEKLDFICEITLQTEKQRSSFLVKVLGQASHDGSHWKITEIYDVEVELADSSPPVP